jgi:hypothetical protein
LSTLQDHIDTIELYRKGCHPGSCTRAILANDLFGAAALADRTTAFILVEIARYIVNQLPHESFGSYAAVDAWLKGGFRDEKQTGI